MSFAIRIFQLVDSGIRVGEEEDFGIFTIILSLFQISFHMREAQVLWNSCY